MENPSRGIDAVVGDSSVVVTGSVQQSTVDCERTVLDIKVTETLKGEFALPENEIVAVEVASIRYDGFEGEGLWFLEPTTESTTVGADFVEVDNFDSVPTSLRSRRSALRVDAGLPAVERRASNDAMLALYDRADIVVHVAFDASDDFTSARITQVEEVLKGNAPLGPVHGPMVRPPPSEEPGGPWEFQVDDSGVLFLSGSFDDPTLLNPTPYWQFTTREIKKLIE